MGVVGGVVHNGWQALASYRIGAHHATKRRGGDA